MPGPPEQEEKGSGALARVPRGRHYPYGLENSIDYFWVSGINIDKNTTWMWATTGRPFTFTDWIDNQPDNWKGNEHCLMLNTNDLGHIWNDYDCLSIINYICEYYD
ncbi:hypothetical protein J6590_067426 [Homalodisca vitripennis]|nr:hypothetical protein J6590_067426 [Homalodisca vitripennis]